MLRITICITTALAACATAGRGEELSDAASTRTDAPSTLADAPLDAPMVDAFVDQCPSSATCPAAVTLGSVDGDSSSLKVTASGYQAAWYRVRVEETDSSPLGEQLKVTAKLTSPAAVGFDVFLYVDENNDVIQCTLPTSTSSTTGTVTTASIEWGEGSISNGDDDGRSVSIEVRPISGACEPSAVWQLEVFGD